MEGGSIIAEPSSSGVPFLGRISVHPELKPHQRSIHEAAEEDYIFGNLSYEISRRMELLDKQLRVRVAHWLGKLSRAKTRCALITVDCLTQPTHAPNINRISSLSFLPHILVFCSNSSGPLALAIGLLQPQLSLAHTKCQ